MLLEPIHRAPGGLHTELRLPAPLAKVFDYLSDLRNMAIWWPEHRIYRRLKGDGSAGSLYVWTYAVRGIPVAGYTRVLAREPNERFEYRAGLPGLGVRIAYRFSADGDATRISFSMSTLLAHLPGFEANAIPEATCAFARLEQSLEGSSRIEA
jgi:uncharacterized protein YndB with AHSA1/START domain